MTLSDVMTIGDLEIRRHEHVVVACGLEVALTTREFEILAALAEHPGWVLSATQLAGDPAEGDRSPESVSVLVSRLRQKLSAAGACDVVETVRGLGYRVRAPLPSSTEPDLEASVSRELRDASWLLTEAVIEMEHSGSAEQQRAAAQTLSRARREIFGNLAE